MFCYYRTVSKSVSHKYTIYIDESGISSRTGHSVYVCVYIVYTHHDNLAEQIIDIEHRLKIPYIHWSNMPWKLRIKLAEKLKALDFKVKAVIYENPVMPDKALQTALNMFLIWEENIIKIIIDGKKGKKYEKELKGLLRFRGVKVYGVKTVNDKSEPIIRLADFIAGSLRSYFDAGDNKNILLIYNILIQKIIQLYKTKPPN